MRRLASLSFVSVAVCVVAASGRAAELLSLQGFPLAANEYVLAFKIDIFGVVPRTVCHIPYGWTVTAGVDGSPVGTFAGVAGHGLNALNTTTVGQLKNLFLIENVDRIEMARPEHPATFDGHIQIGTYGSDAEEVWRPLSIAAYWMSSARRCPDPPILKLE
jgi:hypothetical protein